MAQTVRAARRSTGAKKGKRTLSAGQVHIFASFNNTIVTVTDTEGNMKNTNWTRPARATPLTTVPLLTSRGAGLDGDHPPPAITPGLPA